MEISTFWQKANLEIAKYDLLQHPFYRAWSAGELTQEDLKFYAVQYYHQVSEFPAYLTALHSRLPEGAMRRDVLANAYEEECGGAGSTFALDASGEAPSRHDTCCSHAELWLRFVEGMGADASNRGGAEPIREIGDLVNAFRLLAREAPIASVFGALFAYESQVPRIAAEKLNGLKKYYGADDRTCSYFALHETADVLHSNVWRKIISQLVAEDDRHAAEALEGISRAARALLTALDGIERDRPNHKASGCAARMD
jgi:pyrroloquinoline-quinone synthase